MDSLTQLQTTDEQNMMYLYRYLLRRHNFYWRQSDDHRFLDRNTERERQIFKLKELIDPSGIIYKQFAPKENV